MNLTEQNPPPRVEGIGYVYVVCDGAPQDTDLHRAAAQESATRSGGTLTDTEPAATVMALDDGSHHQALRFEMRRP